MMGDSMQTVFSRRFVVSRPSLRIRAWSRPLVPWRPPPPTACPPSVGRGHCSCAQPCAVPAGAPPRANGRRAAAAVHLPVHRVAERSVPQPPAATVVCAPELLLCGSGRPSRCRCRCRSRPRCRSRCRCYRDDRCRCRCCCCVLDTQAGGGRGAAATAAVGRAAHDAVLRPPSPAPSEHRRRRRRWWRRLG